MRQKEGLGSGDGSVRTRRISPLLGSVELQFVPGASSGLLFSGWFFPFSVFSLKQMLLLAVCKGLYSRDRLGACCSTKRILYLFNPIM